MAVKILIVPLVLAGSIVFAPSAWAMFAVLQPWVGKCAQSGGYAPGCGGAASRNSSVNQVDPNIEAAREWSAQGDAYLAQGRLEDADRAYSKSLSLIPGNENVEEKRQKVRDMRVQKADDAVQPIKQGQVTSTLREINQSETYRLLRAAAAANNHPENDLAQIKSTDICWIEQAGCNDPGGGPNASAPNRLDVPGLVQVFSDDPIVPPDIRNGTAGEMITKIEMERTEARTKLAKAQELLKSLEAGQVEPNPVELKMAIGRRKDEISRYETKIADSNRKITESIDASFHPNARPVN